MAQEEMVAGPCVIVTHRIRAGRDTEFLDALERLQEARRAREWVTDRWLVMKNRDEDGVYTQVVEYVSLEAEAEANRSPELAELRKAIGAESTGYPDHLWTVVARAT